jgi:hypothetical protein
MAPVNQINPSDFGDKARRELLQLLESVRWHMFIVQAFTKNISDSRKEKSGH